MSIIGKIKTNGTNNETEISITWEKKKTTSETYHEKRGKRKHKIRSDRDEITTEIQEFFKNMKLRQNSTDTFEKFKVVITSQEKHDLS